MTVSGKARENLRTLIENALLEAETPEQFLDVATAAAATADAELMGQVAERLGEEIEQVLGTSSSWELQAAYSKLNVWEHTGHAARLLAEAFALVDPDRPTR